MWCIMHNTVFYYSFYNINTLHYRTLHKYNIHIYCFQTVCPVQVVRSEVCHIGSPGWRHRRVHRALAPSAISPGGKLQPMGHTFQHLQEKAMSLIAMHTQQDRAVHVCMAAIHLAIALLVPRPPPAVVAVHNLSLAGPSQRCSSKGP